MVMAGNVINHRLFKVAKAFFAFNLKKLPDGSTDLRLDLVIRIYKRQLEPF